MLSTSIFGSSKCLYTPQIFPRCLVSITNTKSAQFKSFSEIFLSLLGLSPAERILKRSSFLKCVPLSCYAFCFVPKLLICLVFLSFGCCRPKIDANGFGLCVRAGFGAQSFNLLLKFIRSTKLQVCTSARLTQNPC